MLGLGNILTKGGALLGFPNKHSFNFDGSNDYLEIENNSALSFGTNAHTISAWAKIDALANYKTIISKRQAGGTATDYNLSVGANGVVYTYNGSNVAQTATGVISAGSWFHYALVYSGSAYQLYINGSAVAWASGTATSGASNSHDIGIGWDRSGNYWDGEIDEVAIWNTALSASDVAKIASKPIDFSKASTYATDRTSNLKLWLRAGDKVLPEEDKSIARSDFYTDFDGGNEAVIVEQTFTTDNFALSFWINPDNVTGDKYLFDQNGGICRSVVIGYQDGYINFINDDNDAGNYYPTGTASDTQIPVSIGEWQHYVMMTDGTKVYGYRNGVEIINVTGKWGASGAEKFWIGQYEGGLNYEGKMSNVGIYQTVLDAQTIKQFAKSRYTPMRDNRFSVVDFDGSNDYIDCGNDSSLELAGDMTITAWINPTGADSSQGIVTKRDSGGTNYYFALDSSTPPKLTFYDGSGSGTSTGTITKDSWQHIAISIDSGVTNGSIFYINGVASGTATLTITANDAPLVIGRRLSDNYYEGSISSSSVYSTAKSAEEVYAIYQQGITYDESSLSGLQGYWRMGDDTSKAFPTIADSSSNSNDGTMTSMASDDIVQQMVAGYDMGAFESTEELGIEKITNGTFDSDISGWTNYFSSRGDVTWSNSRLRIDNSTGTGATIAYFSTSFTSGKVYKISFDYYHISGSTSSAMNVLFDLTDMVSPPITSGQTTTFYMIPSDNRTKFSIGYFGGGEVYELDNVSVKEVLQSADLSDTYPFIADVNEPVAQERVTNTDFNNTSGWSDGSGRWTIDTSAGTITHDGSDNLSPYLSQNNIFDDANALYEMTITIDSCENFASAGIVKNGSVANFRYSLGINSVGTHTIYFTNSTSGLQVWSNGIVTVISHLSIKKLFGNVGTMTQMLSSNLVYSSVLPDQSFLAGVNSAYNFLDFDGTDAYVDIGTLNFGTSDFTVSMWINFTNIGSYEDIFDNRKASTNGFIIRTTGSSNGIEVLIDAPSNLGMSYTYTSTGQWVHLCVTVDRDGNMILYINGESEATVDISSLSSGTLDHDAGCRLGANEGLSAFFNGKMSGVAVWNKNLSSSTVSAIYNAGRHSNLLDSYNDNLKRYFAFGALDAITGLADTDSTIYDRSGNSNHGTTSGTATGDLASSPNAEPNGYAKGDTNRSTTTP